MKKEKTIIHYKERIKTLKEYLNDEKESGMNRIERQRNLLSHIARYQSELLDLLLNNTN